MKPADGSRNVTVMSPARHDIPDVQSTADLREIDIQRVGIKDIRHPIVFSDRGDAPRASIAEFCMTVHLPKQFKGTHMSRFVQLLNERAEPWSVRAMGGIVRDMNERLNATDGRVELTFPWFVHKSAPVSGVASLMDYHVTLVGNADAGGESINLQVVIPITSLCPCSKEISDYGAHNQRSHVTVNADVTPDIWVEDIIDLVEDQASSELYALLKRPDEKYVTEQAYDNPKFVEDVVRDVAAQLNREPRIRGYTLEVENFEAIHNHSAYALIRNRRTD